MSHARRADGQFSLVDEGLEQPAAPPVKQVSLGARFSHQFQRHTTGAATARSSVNEGPRPPAPAHRRPPRVTLFHHHYPARNPSADAVAASGHVFGVVLVFSFPASATGWFSAVGWSIRSFVRLFAQSCVCLGWSCRVQAASAIACAAPLDRLISACTQ